MMTQVSIIGHKDLASNKIQSISELSDTVNSENHDIPGIVDQDDLCMDLVSVIGHDDLNSINITDNPNTRDETTFVGKMHDYTPGTPNMVSQDDLCLDLISVNSNDYSDSIEPSTNPHPIDENALANTVDIDNSIHPNVVDGDDLIIDLEAEKAQYEWKSIARTELFKAILTSAPTELSWPKFIFWILGTLITSFIWTAPWTLIPSHNVVHNPEYWYEILLPITSMGLLNGIFWTFLTGSLMNTNYIK